MIGPLGRPRPSSPAGTVALTTRQSIELDAVLQPAGVDHPWPEQIGAGRWSDKNSTVTITKVIPRIADEVSADPAQQAGQ